MPDFDPDAYLAATAPQTTATPAFDPDAYLKSMAAPAPTTLENAVGAAGDIARGVVSGITKLPGYAYEAAKIATGITPPLQAAQEIAKEAVPQGAALAKGLQAPVGSREWFGALGQSAIMAAPGLELVRELRAPSLAETLTAPPVQAGGLTETFGYAKPEEDLPTAREITPEVTAENEALAKAEQPAAQSPVRTAATLLPNGEIVEGNTHAESMNKALDMGYQLKDLDSAVNGYTDANGQFLDKAQAFERATNLNQLGRNYLPEQRAAGYPDDWGQLEARAFNKANIQPEGVPNASQITSTEGIPQPEIRPPVGEEAPLRQPREVATARQGIETQPTETVTQEPITARPGEERQIADQIEKWDTEIERRGGGNWDKGIVKLTEQEAADFHRLQTRSHEIDVAKDIASIPELSDTQVVDALEYQSSVTQSPVSEGYGRALANEASKRGLGELYAKRHPQSAEVIAEIQLQKAAPKEPIAPKVKGDLWYSGVGPGGETTWVTSNLEKAKIYAQRRGANGRINVYTPDQVGETAFTDPEGNLISPQEYAKTQSEDTTLQVPPQAEGKPLPSPVQTLDATGKPIEAVAPPEQVAPAAVEVPPPPIGKDVTKDIPAPAPEGDKPVGLTKEYISEDREARGEQPLVQQARKTNPETWDKASQTFAANPNAGHELVASLTENPRAVTEDDLGILLRHRVDLQNQTDFQASRALSEDTPASEKSDALVKLNALQDARNEADAVTRNAGSQAGKSMQFLQRMANEDYTLSGISQQFRAATGGRKLTPAETVEAASYSKDLLEKDAAWQQYLKEGVQEQSALKAYKTRLKTATTENERRLAFQDYEPQIRKQLQLDPEAIQLKGDLERSKLAMQKRVLEFQNENRPTWMKILSGVSYGAREAALSGYHTLAKLATYTGARLAELPLTETAERLWGQVPGFKQIAAGSEFGPGANATQLGMLYREAFTTGMKGAVEQLKTGVSTLRAAFGKEKVRPGYQSFFGNIHGAEKTPLLTGSFAMNRAKLLDQGLEQLASRGIAEGADITSPPVQAAINYKAFQRATSDILQEQNQFADGINGFLVRMEERSKKTGEFSPEKATAAAIIRTFATKGIVRTPANYIMQTIDRTPIGLIRGIGRAGRAFYKGIDTMHPGELSAIMKLMGVGSVGSAMYLWGALDAMHPSNQRIFGGYFQPGEKRDPNDVPFGAMKVGGTTLSHFLTHNPMTESAQMGSTMMRVALSAMSKKDRKNKGFVRGMIASVFGLAEQAPVANPLFRAGAALRDPRTSSSFVGEQVRGLEPMLIQNIASDTDKSTVGRKPEGIIETAKLGIPGLREQVREKKSKGGRAVIKP